MAQSAVPRPHAAFITLSVCSVFPRSIPHQSFSMRTWSHCQFVMMPNINSIGGRYLIGLVNANLTLRFSRFSKASALYTNPKRLHMYRFFSHILILKVSTEFTHSVRQNSISEVFFPRMQIYHGKFDPLGQTVLGNSVPLCNHCVSRQSVDKIKSYLVPDEISIYFRMLPVSPTQRLLTPRCLI